MKRLFFFTHLVCFFSLTSFSQTFTGTGGWIPDDGTSIDFTLTASGLSPGTIDTSNFGLEEVCIDITHTYDEDLRVSLIAPDGTTILLTAANGGSGDDYDNTCFRNDATTPIGQGPPPFTGIFRPQGDLSAINNGQDGNGLWTLHILDTYAWADQGYLYNWSVTFGNNPATPLVNFTSSNLPIIVIDCQGQTIPDDPKITCNMGIIFKGDTIRNYMTDPFNHYNGKIGIEMRGSSSQWFPKKSYGFETHDSAGNNLDTALLGMPSENDWILSASYTDKTFLRNVLPYKLYRDFGRYAACTRFCEMVLDGQYQGIYVLTEKIKRDKNRVDIAKLTTLENSGDDLTGGYIIKIDKQTGSGGTGWTSPYPPMVNPNGQEIFFQYEYPGPDSITGSQKTYIQQYVDSFENTLAGSFFDDPVNGYVKYCEANSFIDYFILNEISKNIDGYRLSTFLYKDKTSNGGKMTIGPPWDYDIAWLNANYCGSPSHQGWAYLFGDECPGDNWQVPFWWDRFLQDTNFANQLKCRYLQLRATFLDTANINAWVDSNANYLSEAQARNFTLWPIIGQYVWPNPNPIPSTWQGEIDRLKQWIADRLDWLDLNLTGNCIITSAASESTGGDLYVYPNPSDGIFMLRINNRKQKMKNYEIRIINVLGETLFRANTGNEVLTLTINQPPGCYYLQVINSMDCYARNVPFIISPKSF
ncbi:MAG: CotH kinase family protein [Bacteroidetes bacterium]|nr:CotH kinase family protein [Bacteroidota bacterium]